MAFDAFLKLGDGQQAAGESADPRHPRAIAVLGYSLEGANPVTVGGGGPGRAQVGPLRVTKRVDAASPVLFQACCGGQRFATAALTVRKAGGSAPLDYLVYALTEVYVTKVTTAGGGPDDVPAEVVELGFAAVHLTYTPQRPDGTGGSPVEGGWDLAKNRPA